MFKIDAEKHCNETLCSVCENPTCTEHVKCREWRDRRAGFYCGAEFGYNKGKKDVKHDLMMKLKDEGIVKPLKDSIFRNERLSSQQQQELCAWIECAMDFGENLDECAKELEEVNKVNEWHFVKDGKPKDNEYVLIYTDLKNTYVARIPTEKDYFITRRGGFVQMSAVIAWKEIVLPELKESE